LQRIDRNTGEVVPIVCTMHFHGRL
jgi:hypothetical protein